VKLGDENPVADLSIRDNPAVFSHHLAAGKVLIRLAMIVGLCALVSA
jgi:hypothetical protein